MPPAQQRSLPAARVDELAQTIEMLLRRRMYPSDQRLLAWCIGPLAPEARWPTDIRVLTLIRGLEKEGLSLGSIPLLLRRRGYDTRPPDDARMRLPDVCYGSHGSLLGALSETYGFVGQAQTYAHYELD